MYMNYMYIYTHVKLWMCLFTKTDTVWPNTGWLIPPFGACVNMQICCTAGVAELMKEPQAPQQYIFFRHGFIVSFLKNKLCWRKQRPFVRFTAKQNRRWRSRAWNWIFNQPGFAPACAEHSSAVDDGFRWKSFPRTVLPHGEHDVWNGYMNTRFFQGKRIVGQVCLLLSCTKQTGTCHEFTSKWRLRCHSSLVQHFPGVLAFILKWWWADRSLRDLDKRSSLARGQRFHGNSPYSLPYRRRSRPLNTPAATCCLTFCKVTVYPKPHDRPAGRNRIHPVLLETVYPKSFVVVVVVTIRTQDLI